MIYDDDIDYRTVDGRNVCAVTENIARLRIGCDGGSIGMVATDSLDGDGRG